MLKSLLAVAYPWESTKIIRVTVQGELNLESDPMNFQRKESKRFFVSSCSKNISLLVFTTYDKKFVHSFLTSIAIEDVAIQFGTFLQNFNCVFDSKTKINRFLGNLTCFVSKINLKQLMSCLPFPWHLHSQNGYKNFAEHCQGLQP